MTAPTLLSDAALSAAVAYGRIPLCDPDARLAVWARQGRIVAAGPVWAPNVRWQPPLSAEVREYIAADVAYERATDV